MYEIQFSSQAARYFKKLKEKPLKDTYKAAIQEISVNGNYFSINIGN
jgi:mRNA interferase RelE/StbE